MSSEFQSSMADRFQDGAPMANKGLTSPSNSFEGRDTALGQQCSLLASIADHSSELCTRLQSIERRLVGDHPTAECAQKESMRFDEHSALGALESESMRLRYNLMRMQETIQTLDSVI